MRYVHRGKREKREMGKRRKGKRENENIMGSDLNFGPGHFSNNFSPCANNNNTIIIISINPGNKRSFHKPCPGRDGRAINASNKSTLLKRFPAQDQHDQHAINIDNIDKRKPQQSNSPAFQQSNVRCATNNNTRCDDKRVLLNPVAK